MNFDELKREVTKIHHRTGDVIAELEWKLYLASRRAELWGNIVTIGTANPKLPQWKQKQVKTHNQVIHYRELLSVAKTIICEECGELITDDNHYDFLAGDGQGGELPCAANDTIIPF
jgi:hypothetical protein